MITTTKKYHYKDLDGTDKTHEAVTHHFTAGSDELNNEVCLVNTCGDYTGFDDIPEVVDKWFEKIGIAFTHFPNLSKLWGETRSEYAFTLRYELEHERDSVMEQKTICINGELKVNDLVLSTFDDDFAYLVGSVSEIRALGSPEHETENDEDDVYVNFSEFEYFPVRIKEIEHMFSDLYGYPKVFEELPLGDVIMGPSCLINISGIDEVVLRRLLECEANAAEYCNSVIQG